MTYVHFYMGGVWIFDRAFYATNLQGVKRQATKVLNQVGAGWNCRIRVAPAKAGASVYHIKVHGGAWKASALRFQEHNHVRLNMGRFT